MLLLSSVQKGMTNESNVHLPMMVLSSVCLFELVIHLGASLFCIHICHLKTEQNAQMIDWVEVIVLSAWYWLCETDVMDVGYAVRGASF